jgi:hypothetical protein
LSIRRPIRRALTDSPTTLRVVKLSSSSYSCWPYKLPSKLACPGVSPARAPDRPAGSLGQAGQGGVKFQGLLELAGLVAGQTGLS